MTGPELLEALNVTAERGPGGFRLAPTTWRLPAGQVHGCVGESGAGKTTLARILAGLDRPRRGRLRLCGRVGAADRAYRRAVQYLPQDPAATLDPRYSLSASVREAAAAGGRSVDSAEVLKRVGLDPSLADRRPGSLSGGQRQRAGWARLAALAPRFAILDEPLTALDPARALELEAFIRELARGGTGIMVVSHDLVAIERLASHVGVMWRGRLVEFGPVERLRVDPRHPYTARLWASVPSRDRTE